MQYTITIVSFPTHYYARFPTKTENIVMFKFIPASVDIYFSLAG